MKALSIPSSTLDEVFNLDYSIVTVPRCLHFVNRDTYRNRVDAILESSQQNVILDMRSLAYVDVSAIMTLQVRFLLLG